MQHGADAVGEAELRAHLDAGLAAMAPAIAEAADERARALLVRYVLLLARWNQAYNLTAVREPLQMVPRHLLDSLAVLPWVERGPVLDLGTGAGLPGIPLAIACPQLAFTLLDSNGKKTRFVRQVVLELGIENVEVIQMRLEAYRPERKFATIVARALASLPSLCSSAQRLATTDGRLLALKGRLASQELAALAGPGPELGAGPSPAADAPAPAASGTQPGAARLHALVVPEVDGERFLIEVPLGSSNHG